MHYVVCVKQVPDTTEVKIDPKTNTLIREGVPSIMNPYDVHAVEAAIQLKEKYGGKVTVLSMGPPLAKEVLKKAIGLGADEAVLISDRAFAGADSLATSYALTKAIEKINEQEKIDLIICGKQAIDGDTAQVGPGIASRLNISQLTYVMEIKEISDNSISVFRKVKGGQELSKTKLPALLTVITDINDVRYSSLDNLIKAARFDYKTWTKDNLDADIEHLGLKGSATMVRNIFAPPQREKGEIIPGGEGNGEKAIATLLDKLIPLDIIPN
ncbi:electron transfer flavoprotein beta subunit [Desulfonispora thiosulfatigenes DSM 11270]|uniref:Electron transfer flavoprotein small subunit n=1 Tax=Desulfonispora thiosulfatigenes DSM 11270 TaxID=656914 RepID=A0A1W1VDH5_DESTI|nr:electron transfer flavoprotein subunit beta/FixA family protein [Desulfonispora thiosulfatigenes]SMB91432.1 electron transfer flavoprotein beta subunit [Desulfonispora thiosulfatigenes DSM 11270]